MPVHDWTLVDAGIFHAFHQRWIGMICDVLNNELLEDDYYALPEQWAGGRNPDVLPLRGRGEQEAAHKGNGRSTAIRERPNTKFVVESEPLAYARKKSRVVVRHVSGDRVVALIEIVSPGNKDGRNAFEQFTTKVIELLRADVNVLLIDLLPRTNQDRRGIHAILWEAMSDQRISTPRQPPFSLVSYETGDVLRGYFEPVGLGDRLPDMPLFLEYGWHVSVPLEQTSKAAYRTVPHRWRRVIEGLAR